MKGLSKNMNSIIISIMNSKGGVGKTTVTCNLSDGLARRGKKVLVVDMDTQSNTTKTLLPQATLEYTFYEFISPGSSEEIIKKCIHATQNKNLHCIPNINETSSLEPDLIERKDFYAIRDKLRPYVQEKYDFCLLDCPPNMGTWVITALYGSDFVIIPTLANSSYSIDGLLKAVTLINNVRKNGNKNLRFLKLLINQVHKRQNICQYNINQIQQNFPEEKIFNTMIPVNVTFSQAETGNKTIFKEAPTSRGCLAYRNLSQEIIDIFNNEGEK